MTYEVLARKWRPQTFENVIGQEHVTATLMNALKSGRLAHAYLFSGPRGIGKTTVARILAKAVNCQGGTSGNPCNVCSSCVGITSGKSIDVQEIDGASNRGIDEIRELRDNIGYMPLGGRYRIYIIDEVHMLTQPAFNALLKTLEEPPHHVKFIFATTEPHKIPYTILSRCQRFDLRKITFSQIIEHLRYISDKENLAVSDDALSLVARQSGGSMRDAESLLDQVIAFTGDEIKDSDIINILGIIDNILLSEILTAVVENNPAAVLSSIELAYNRGYDMKDFYSMLLEQFRNLLVAGIDPEKFSENIVAEEKERLILLAEKAGVSRCQAYLDFLISKESNIRYTLSPRIVMETILVRTCTLGDYYSFAELLHKVETLEKSLSNSETKHADSDSIKNDYRKKDSPIPEIKENASNWSGQINKSLSQEEEKSFSWEKIISHIKAKNKMLAGMLKNIRFSDYEAGNIRLITHEDKFNYFSDNENLTALKKIIEGFLKRQISIKIDYEPANPAGDKFKEKSDMDFSASDDGTKVQSVLRIFDGTVEPKK